MRIGRAIYGERSRGHALLEASPAAEKVAAAIAGRMDLGGTQPPGSVWSPYVSGFRHEGHYVVARTLVDVRAERPGMVFSQALVIDLDDMAQTDNIQGLFDLLISLNDDRDTVADMEWQSGGAEALPSLALAQALLADGDGPVVWPRQAGFDEAIAGLWRHLWPEARTGLSFGFAFRPQDLATNPPSIIATPDTLANRWGNFRQAISAPTILEAPAALLSGQAGGKPLRDLIERLEANPPALSDLLQLESLHAVLEGDRKFAAMSAALRMSAYLSPDPKHGTAFKQELLDWSVEVLANANPSEVMTSRNLKLDAFVKRDQFWKALAKWAQGALWVSADAAIAAKLICATASDTGAVAEWTKAILSGIRNAVSSAKAEIIGGLWRIAIASPPIIDHLMAQSDDLEAFSQILVKHVPRRIDVNAGNALLKSASVVNYPELHAAIAASAFSPIEAVDAHVDGAEYDQTSLSIALRHATPKQVVDVALKRDLSELFSIAGRIASEAPEVLAPIAISNKRWQLIWREALGLKLEVWNAPQDPRSTADTLWSKLSEGDGEVLQLLRPLAATPLADISAHPARPHLWDRIPADLRPAVLAATAKGAAKSFLVGTFDESVEDILVSELTKREYCNDLLNTTVSDPMRGAALFRLLPSLDEDVFRKWVDMVLAQPAPLSVETAQSLGRLIAARSWSRIASYFASLATSWFSSRSDVRPALQNCLDLLGPIDRFFLGMSAAPIETARWQVLEETAIEIYFSGPNHDELWSRAGGKKAYLPSNGNGAQKWRTVLTQARDGRVDVKMAVLVKKMHEDYPNNEVLKKLHRDGVFSR